MKNKEQQLENNKKILIIDDEEGWRDLLTYDLANTGHEVVTAKNGTEALKKFAEVDFDLVISDFKMPGMDGIELLRAMKEIKPEAKTVLMSAHIYDPKIQKEMEQDNFRCVDKSAMAKNIPLVISKFLNND